MIKVDRARKARTHDRLANHACELPIENGNKAQAESNDKTNNIQLTQQTDVT